MDQIQIAIEEAITLILGPKTLGYYFAGFFFCGLAILLSLYRSSRKRDVESPRTPKQFSWRFLLWDNAKRAFITLVLAFLFLRLFDMGSPALMVGLGFFLSFGLDYAIEWLMNNTNIVSFLKRDRSKFPQHDQKNDNLN